VIEHDPRHERRALLTLAAVQFCHIVDFMIMMPLGPSLIAALGIGMHQFGILVAAYSFSAGISCLLAATFIDRFERRALLRLLFLLFGLATLGCALAPDFATLLAMRILAGAFGGVLGALVQTMVADLVPFARRGAANGLIMSAFSLATIAGIPFSLLLANQWGWRAPFMFIALLVLLLLLAALRLIPELRQHMRKEEENRLLADLFAVLADANLRRAQLFSATLIFSGFMVIPWITLYAVGNVGITMHEIPLIYLVGGAATLVSARLIGRWADRFGKQRVFYATALACILPLLLLTHTGAAPLWLWLVCTTLFFVLISGRMIPAMALVASAPPPPLRGTFMAVNSSAQLLANALAATCSGFIVTQSASGALIGFGTAGWLAVGLNLLAMLLAARLMLHEERQ